MFDCTWDVHIQRCVVLDAIYNSVFTLPAISQLEPTDFQFLVPTIQFLFKQGWITYDEGVWRLTDAGLSVYSQYLDLGEFYEKDLLVYSLVTLGQELTPVYGPVDEKTGIVCELNPWMNDPRFKESTTSVDLRVEVYEYIYQYQPQILLERFDYLPDARLMLFVAEFLSGFVLADLKYQDMFDEVQTTYSEAARLTDAGVAPSELLDELSYLYEVGEVERIKRSGPHCEACQACLIFYFGEKGVTSCPQCNHSFIDSAVLDRYVPYKPRSVLGLIE